MRGVVTGFRGLETAVTSVIITEATPVQITYTNTRVCVESVDSVDVELDLTDEAHSAPRGGNHLGSNGLQCVVKLQHPTLNSNTLHC